MTATAEGLVYVILAGEGPGAGEEAREALRRLRSRLPDGCAFEEREVPGALWGFIPAAAGAPDTVTHAAAGSLEVVLRGDPLWMEPHGPGRCEAAELLRLFEKEGPGALDRLDNAWLAIISDGATGEILVATDRIGGIRLYETAVGKARVLCTSYLLASAVSNDRKIDADAIAIFLHLGYLPGNRTALRSVSTAPFGSVQRVVRGVLRRQPSWTPALGEARSAADLDPVVAAFNRSVRECAAGPREVRLALTAGLDSRCILSSLIRQRIPFGTYTHGFPGCSEARRVDRLVRRHDLPHDFVRLERRFSDRLRDLALESFRATGGEISAVERSHLPYVLSLIRERAEPGAALLLGGGAGALKGTYYRLLREEDPYSGNGVERYVSWILEKRLPDIFSDVVPARNPAVLRGFVRAALDSFDGGTLFQRLDLFFLLRYRRWAGAIKSLYRRFLPVREPFVTLGMLQEAYGLPTAVKKARLPHFEILAQNWPRLQYDLTGTMSPALPLRPGTLPRFVPSIAWRVRQAARGLSRRYLPRELFPALDYVDYGRWIRTSSGMDLVTELLDPARMKSGFLYEEGKLRRWLAAFEDGGAAPFHLLDKMCTLELFFREVDA